MTARTGADVKKNVTRSDRNQIGRMMHATVNEVKQKKGGMGRLGRVSLIIRISYGAPLSDRVGSYQN